MKQFNKVYLLLFIIYVDGQSITLDGQWTGTIKSCRTHFDGLLLPDEALTAKCRHDVTFPAVVPGGIYTDLFREGIISNNLFGRNDVENRWVGNKTVIYWRNFDVNQTFLDSSKIVLIFHGLDTFATIYLNDIRIGETSNMFLKHILDVKEYLMVNDNTLSVKFTSPVKEAERLFNKQSAKYIVPPICVPKEYNGVCHVNHIRKMQASFGWDWGPAFPSMGIWKSVELHSVNDALITDVTTDIFKSDETWKVIVTVFFDLSTYDRKKIVDIRASSVLLVTESLQISNFTDISVESSRKSAHVSIILNVPMNSVERWWPNDYGTQRLYTVKTTVTTPRDIAYQDTRIGFRTLELVEEPLKQGLSFYFRVNGIPVFAKGSNYIPSSVFPESTANEDTVRGLMESAKSTHMNMLRVWGGGMYESKLFYDLADEYGIMIWQDFMFACSMYPTTKEFLSSVMEEIQQNVRRLKNHPSIVLWAGNNENEAALFDDWYGTGDEQVYRDDYIKLYVDLIKQRVEELDQTRPFVVSSPSNGRYAETYNYTGQNPYSNLYGDVHYYNYLSNGWDINQYPHPRFSSEYGFQSLPSIYTLSGAAATLNDLEQDSEFMHHRQHLTAGNQYMKALISKNLKIPKTDEPVIDFVDYIYLSQINQAVSVQIQTESYRQLRSELNSKGEGLTMGALYWQLNDVWQAPSWSSIDFDGRWKMLHYYAKDFFAPVIVTSRLTQANELLLYVVSDRLDAITDCVLRMNVYRWNSTTPIHSTTYTSITVGPNNANSIASIWLNEFLTEANCGSLGTAKKHCIISLTLEDVYGGRIAPTNYVYPTVLKDVNLSSPNITANIDKRSFPGKFWNYADIEIELTSDNVALFVWLDVGNIRGRFSQNGFHMFENRKIVIFHGQESTTPAVLRKHLRITTLSDIYKADRTPFDASSVLLGGQ